jgi:hypothetical protein
MAISIFPPLSSSNCFRYVQIIYPFDFLLGELDGVDVLDRSFQFLVPLSTLD